MDTTTKHAIPFLEGSDLAAEADTVSQAQSERLDDIIAIDSQGSFASRPTSTPGSPGKEGRYYFATDTEKLYRDHGTGWTEITLPDLAVTNAKVAAGAAIAESKLALASDAAAGTASRRTLGTGAAQAAPGNDSRFPAGADIVVGDLAAALATEVGAIGSKRGDYVRNSGTGTRTNTAYGNLNDAADEVTGIVIGADDILLVRFIAQSWIGSVSDAARAAIFIGSDQLRVPVDIAASPATQAAVAQGTSVVQLCTYPGGLIASNVGFTPSAFPTTGVALASFMQDSGHKIELGGSVFTENSSASGSTQLGITPGGACEIFGLPAGTYTVAVRYKSTSGQVSVTDRRLWATAARLPQ